MTAERFTVRTMGRCWFHVFLYQDLQGLRRAAHRWNPAAPPFDDTEGVCQGFDELPANRYLGVIRLVRSEAGLVDTQVMLHECVHMTIQQIRRTVGMACLWDVSEGDFTLTEVNAPHVLLELPGDELLAHAIDDVQVAVLEALGV